MNNSTYVCVTISHMFKKKNTMLMCFSPPVMVVTVIIEVSLLFYTLWRYKMNTLARLVVLALLALAAFQLCEYYVCTGSGASIGGWSRLGYAAITTLPPLGLHILHVLAKKPSRRLVIASYASMIGFITYFLVVKGVFSGYQCTGNYVIFQIGVNAAIAYGIYYYGWLLVALALGARWANGLAKQGKKSIKQVNSIKGLIVGYLVFLVPTALAYSVSPSARRGIPSIMCGFAVLFAIILTIYILPLVSKSKR